MDNKEEYHDPDYAGTSVQVKEEPPGLTEEEKDEKIRQIIQREFKNEIDARRNEVMLADQRLALARRILHRLRYTLVSRYYQDQKLQLPDNLLEPETSVSLRGGQRRIHPSVRKLLGKRTADIEEIFRPLSTRNKRRDYSAMVQPRNTTTPAEATMVVLHNTTDPPETPLPTPQPRLRLSTTNVLAVDNNTRNKRKHRYRIIVGNTSKYAPAASAQDRSTHKWLLYVRGTAGADAARILKAVTVTLHHSYAPHHIVHIDKPPYHVSRRGWGEFPAKVELHFRLPERNRPATLEHTIKLDRNYTGLQTLGAETLVDVWLYSTPDMLEMEYKEDEEMPPKDPEPVPIVPKEEPVDPPTEPEPTDNWLDFFTTETKLDVDEMIIKPTKTVENLIENVDFDVDVKPDILELEKSVKVQTYKQDNLDWSVDTQTEIPDEILKQPPSPKKRIMKYLDQNTGKIYYLEMDRKLDLSKVQEIVINSKGNIKTAKLSPVKPVNGKVKKGQSLLKPEVKNMLSNKVKTYTHITNDHTYLGSSWVNSVNFLVPEVKHEVKSETTLYDSVCAAVARFTCVRVAVNYLLKKIPIITEEAIDPDFKRCFPFVETDERFWKMDFAKRRNKEWSRAKLINTILQNHLRTQEPIWRTKQILIFSRLHGYQPIRKEIIHSDSSWELEPDNLEVTTLSVFNPEEFNKSITESIDVSDDEDIEIVGDVPMKVQVKKEKEENLTVIPVEKEEDRHRFMFIERKCADIGIELRNEDVGNGFSYSAVHAVLLSALKSFSEELLRSSLAASLVTNAEPPPTVWTGYASPGALSARHILAGARGRLAAVTRRGCGAPHRTDNEAI